jgi:hypothetical protein
MDAEVAQRLDEIIRLLRLQEVVACPVGCGRGATRGYLERAEMCSKCAAEQEHERLRAERRERKKRKDF